VSGIILVILAIVVCVVTTSKPSKIPLNGSHVLISGGSSGIGLEIAKLCAAKGSIVTLLARNIERLGQAKTAVDSFSLSGQECNIVSVDISKNFEHVETAIKEAVKAVGRPVDILFNCAGTSCSAAFMDLPVESFKSLMDINYFGAVYCTKAVLGGMKQRKRGRIVFLSSQAGQTGVYGYTAYSASKFALRGLAETLQMEVKHLNIGVTISFPPDTETPGFEVENRDKPTETRLISGDGVAFDPKHVASSILDDTLKGNFMNYVGLDGFILGHSTSGMAPCNSVFECLIQFFFMGIFRIISLGYLKSFNKIVRVCALKKRK